MSAQYHSLTVGYNRFFIDQRYSNLKPIGDGSYGFVVSATDRVTGQKVAIKKIKDTFIDVVDAKRILRELKLLRHLSGHENIISILDIMSVPPNTQRFDDIYIVTNLMESDLERIIRSKQVLTNQHLQYFIYQILRGLKFVHSANILHRDLKPSNLLVNANCDLALCDFGLARGFETENVDLMTGYVVTRWYRAPELLCECPSYGKAVDIWSVGCIFAELLVHEPFLRGDTPQHQLEVIVSKLGCPPREKLSFIPNTGAINSILRYESRRPPAFHSFFPPNTNSVGLDLLSKMLQFHPDDRITVEDALAHPYLKDFHGQMPEPNAKSLFDFDFERSDQEDLPESEVRRLMFEEVCLYRPVGGEAKASTASGGCDDKHGDAKGGRDAKHTAADAKHSHK
jgi:serine/threonine protein kinase